MRKTILTALLGLAFAATAAAQTISPVIVEYREKAKGSFQIYNDTFVPMSVVLEAKSFSVDDEGSPTFRSLDPETSVELSATSFRIGPQQTYTVVYKAESSRLPTWFSIYATITGPQAPSGLKLVLELPHTVYLLTKKPLAREAVILHRADSLTAKHQIAAEIENRGAEFSRIREIEVVSSSGKQQFAGFPLFPGQKRSLQINWEQKDQPQMLVLKFDHFKVESPIKPMPSP